MPHSFPELLVRLRDGNATREDHQRARALVEVDERLPEELRAIALLNEEEAAEDAAALLAVFGEPLFDLPVELAAEAGESDVAAEVTAALGFMTVPVAEAVAHEAGRIDVADAVLALLGEPMAIPVSEAVRAEAGSVDVSAAVMAALGAAPVANRPPAIHVPETLPTPANDHRGWLFGRGTFGRGVAGAVALAAVALLAFVVGRAGGPGVEPVPQLVFAQAGDLVVDDLTYSEGVQVAQLEGAEGAVILWVDDGEVGS